jgi:hypothetical protein
MMDGVDVAQGSDSCTLTEAHPPVQEKRLRREMEPLRVGDGAR